MKIFEIVITEKPFKIIDKKKKDSIDVKGMKLHMLFAGKDAKEAKEKANEAFGNRGKKVSIGRPNMILNTD